MALVRVLVVAPAHELRAVAYAVAGDVVEPDLYDQLRTETLPDELLLGLPAAGLARPALAGAVGLEQLDQLAFLLCGEARGVADHVQLGFVVVHPEYERADGALLLAEAEGRHHRVGRADPLDLDHPRALARAVRCVALLR